MHVGKTIKQICKFGAVNCTKMRLAAGLHPDPLGSYSASPDPIAVITEWGRDGEEKVENRKRE